MAVELAEAQALVLAAAADAPDGPGFDDATRALVAFALAASPTTLDVAAMREHARAALEAGVGAEELTEAMLLVALVGNHSLHEGARVIAAALDERGDRWVPSDGELALRATHVGDDAYWRRLEAQLPGFLDALLRLTPEGFDAFFGACALPFRGRATTPLVKELICVGLDVAPTHRYLPGLRLHLDNCLRLGATGRQLREVVELAQAAGRHPGVA